MGCAAAAAALLRRSRAMRRRGPHDAQRAAEGGGRGGGGWREWQRFAPISRVPMRAPMCAGTVTSGLELRTSGSSLLMKGVRVSLGHKSPLVQSKPSSSGSFFSSSSSEAGGLSPLIGDDKDRVLVTPSRAFSESLSGVLNAVFSGLS